MSRPNAGLPVVLIAIVVLLPAAYLGTYYGLLSGTAYFAEPTAVRVSDIYMVPDYRYNSGFVRTVLEPAHQLDRRLWQRCWELHPPAYLDPGTL